MNMAVFQGIIDRLRADATLTTYLGKNRVFRVKSLSPAQIPCITVGENNESSKLLPSYSAFKQRENTTTVQIDIWVSSSKEGFPSTGEDGDTIANRVDAVILEGVGPVGETWGWRRTSSSQQYDHETSIWHNALRYSFKYRIEDA